MKKYEPLFSKIGRRWGYVIKVNFDCPSWVINGHSFGWYKTRELAQRRCDELNNA